MPQQGIAHLGDEILLLLATIVVLQLREFITSFKRARRSRSSGIIGKPHATKPKDSIEPEDSDRPN